MARSQGFVSHRVIASRAIARSGFLMYDVKHVSDPTEERAGLLLYVLLYVCVFWRGEAEQLA